MNLGTAKDKVWQILDEFSSGGVEEKDADIALKMNNFFDIAQKRLAQKKRIVKLFIPVLDDTGTDAYKEYAMPADFYALKQLWADYEPVFNGVWRNKKLLLPRDESRKIEVEYYAFPTDITKTTADTYEFEIDKDAQECMPFFVAANCAMSEFTADSGQIMAVYNQMVNELFKTDPAAGVKVVQIW